MISTYERHQHISSVTLSLVIHAILLFLLFMYTAERVRHVEQPLLQQRLSSLIEFVPDTDTNTNKPTTPPIVSSPLAGNKPQSLQQTPTPTPEAMPSGIPLSTPQGLHTPPPLTARLADWHTQTEAADMQMPPKTPDDVEKKIPSTTQWNTPLTNVPLSNPTADHGRAAVTGKKTGMPHQQSQHAQQEPEVEIPTTFGQLAQGLLHTAATSVRLAALPTENNYMLMQQYKAKAWSWLRQSFYGHQRLFHISRSLETKIPMVMTIAKDGTFLDLHFACQEKSPELKEVEAILVRTARLAGLFPPIPRALELPHITMSVDFGVFVKEGFHTYDICIGA